MSDKLTIYNNGSEVLNAFTPFYQEVAVAKIREAEALDGWFALLSSAAEMAADRSPSPIRRIRAPAVRMSAISCSCRGRSSTTTTRSITRETET